MKTNLVNLSSSALISFLLILPFMIMEVVNRWNYNDDFPNMLFFVMWLNLFAISLILLPVIRGWRTGRRDTANPVPAQGNTLLSNPRSATLIGVLLLLFLPLLAWLGSIGWAPLDRLVNGPDPEQLYVPGLFINLVLFAIPLAGGIIVCRPVVRTLQAGGSLFAHPINLIIIVLLVSSLAIGLGSLIIDQWPCFIGVPHCD